MAEKKDEKKGDQKKGDGGKKEDGPITVIFKVDMHCDGCAKKVKRSVRRFEGVESVKGDSTDNKLTVVGKVNPEMLRERIETKTKKKVVLVSPLPKKEKEGGEKKGGEEKEKKGSEKKGEEEKEKKPKEPAVTTAVLKIHLHCDGCIQKIRRTIRKIKGVEQVTIDKLKHLVTVKGTMNVKALQDILKEKLKSKVEIVPPKKEDGGGDKKGKEGGGGGGGEKKDKEGGDQKKENKEKKEGGGEGGKKEEGGKAEVGKMEYHPGFPYSGYGYQMEYVHAPQIFSDENPNACSIM